MPAAMAPAIAPQVGNFKPAFGVGRPEVWNLRPAETGEFQTGLDTHSYLGLGRNRARIHTSARTIESP
jgi:hypothetical protein